MRTWVFAAICLALAGLVLGEYELTPRPNSNRALVAALSQDLRFTYHACVPLGWKPVPVHGTYYPGYTAAIANYAEWLDAIWRGSIAKRDLRNPDAKTVFEVLNHLTQAGLLTRKEFPRRYRYFLTPRAFGYYDGASVYKNNRDSLPYLCYSVIAPDRIVWLQRIPSPRGWVAGAQWYNVQFAWKPGARAGWTPDTFLRSHSVVLPPVDSPTSAKVYYSDNQWHLVNVYDRGWMLPALGNAASR